MILYPCLRCSLPELPIEVRRCPRCGEENFIPVNRTLSAPESHPEPINETAGFSDAYTQQIGEAKDIRTGCSPNQNTDLKAEQQLQNCSNNPVVKNNTLQDIPTEYDHPSSFNADDDDICDSASTNILATVSAHDDEPQNWMDSSNQPQSKREYQSSGEMATGSYYPDEMSRFINEDGKIDFAGCRKCHKKFAYSETFNMDQQSERDLNPWKCEKCLCTFSSCKILNRHQLVHSEERPFKCHLCFYACKRKDDLEKHICGMHFHIFF